MNAPDARSSSAPRPGLFSVTPQPSDEGGSSAGLGLAGEFDLAGLETWRVAAVGWCERWRDDVVVDLRHLRFIDAAGMGALVGLGNTLRTAGRRMSVAHAAPNVRRALAAGGLAHLVSA